jgi:hypothetical protein
MADIENVPKNAAQLISRRLQATHISVRGKLCTTRQLQFYKMSQNGLIQKSGYGNNLESGMYEKVQENHMA